MLFEKYNKYYTEKKQKFEKIFESDNIIINFLFEGNRHIVQIDINNKPKLRAEYEILGNYDAMSSIWVWSWTNPFIERKLTESALKIKNKENDIYKFNGDYKEIELINYLITNPTIYISNKNMDILFKIMLYYSDGNWIIKKVHDEYPMVFEYILIKNILNIY